MNIQRKKRERNTKKCEQNYHITQWEKLLLCFGGEVFTQAHVKDPEADVETEKRL